MGEQWRSNGMSLHYWKFESSISKQEDEVSMLVGFHGFQKNLGDEVFNDECFLSMLR